MLWLLPCAALVAAPAFAATAPAASGLDAAVPPRHPVVSAAAGASGSAQTCSELGQANECFDALGNAFLNVGAFFDATRPSSSSHFFLKLFHNETADSLRLTGMGFYARTTEPTQRVFQAAGAIVMGSDRVFPRGDALLNLQTVGIVSAPETDMTCVEFDEAIDTKGRRVPAVLGPGEWAWLALRFPELAEDVILEIRVDDDTNDQDCDFLTQDEGEHWYRPDPRSTPHYDWGITVFTGGTASRPDPEPPTWTLVKSLYR